MGRKSILTNQSIILKEGTEINSIFIDKAESWEEFCMVGQELRLYKDSSQWLLGLLALRVEKKYGENSLGKFAKEIGVQVSSLQVYRWVVTKYVENNPDFKPVPKLPFTLYRALANLPVPERNALLKQADEGDFSIERVRLEKDRYTHPERKEKPRFQIKWCEVHNKWIFQPKNPDDFEIIHA